MSYKTKITTLGLAKLATAIANSTTISLTTMKLGDGNGNHVDEPNVNASELLRTVWTGSLSYIKPDPVITNRFIAEAVVPSNVGGWTVREVGLFDSDGDLIVNANFPEVYKPTDTEGAVRDLIVRIYFEVVNGDTIAIEFDPSVVVASRSWVSDNFSLVALLPGGTTGQILRKHSNADGDVEWYDPTSGLVVIVDVIEEQQTLAALQTVVNLATAATDGAAYYVEGVRLHPGDYTVNSATQLTLAESYPAGSKILIVQNDIGSPLQFLHTAQNLADVPNKATARGNLGLLTDTTYLDALWKLMNQRQYPVGEIYTTRQAGNPATLLGFGTWERYGSGRVLVSLDPSDASFNEVDKTGGAKTHTLSVSEIPSHGHNVDPPSTATSNSGSHEHFVVNGDTTTESGPNVSPSRSIVIEFAEIGDNSYRLKGSTTNPTLAPTSTSGAHTHTINIEAFASGSTGGGQAHNNLQPFITVNVWKRTA